VISRARRYIGRAPDAQVAVVLAQPLGGAGEHADATRVEERHVLQIDDHGTGHIREHVAQRVAAREVELAPRDHDGRRAVESFGELRRRGHGCDLSRFDPDPDAAPTGPESAENLSHGVALRC